MLELLLSILFMMIFANVNVNPDNDEKDKDDDVKDDEETKTDTEDKDEKEDEGEEDEEETEEDEDFDLEEFSGKKLSEIPEAALSKIMESDKIDLDALLLAIKEQEDKTIDSFITAENKDKSDDEQQQQKTAKDKTEAKTVTVDDSYIQKFIADYKTSFQGSEEEFKQVSEELTGILKGINGETFSPKALQNYINSQLYIKKIKSPLDENWQMPEESKTEEYIKQAEAIKGKTLAEKLKQKFPDFPDDPNDQESLLEFEESLSRREYAEYQKLYEQEKAKIDKEFDRYFYISNNWEKIAVETIKADLSLFENKLKEAGISPQDLGLDLSLDNDGYNKFIYDNILLPNGKINDKLVHYIGNTVPVIEPRAIYKELMDLFFNDIVETAKHKGQAHAYREAQKDIPEPSGTHKTKSGLLDGEEEINVLDDFDADDEMLDKILNKVKRKILKG